MGFMLPAGVVNTDAVYLFADMTYTFATITKDIDDQTLVVVDYSHLAPPLVVSSWTFEIDVSSNPALVVSYSHHDVAGRLVFLLSGGIAGQQYNLTISVNSGGTGRTDTVAINIPSLSEGAANPVPTIYTQIPLGSPTQGYVNTAVRYFWGAAAPTAPTVMDQWYDPNTHTLYEWATDGTNFYWQFMASVNPITEAPEDNKLYSRYNGTWVADAIQNDAPTDGKNYARNNGAWVIDPITIDAPIDTNTYGRKNGVWVIVPTAVITSDAPLDGQYYSRQNGLWAVPPANPIRSDAPSDGNSYARSNGAWASGGTFTGSITTNSSLTALGALSIGGNAQISGITTFGAQITLPSNPVAPLQAATKQYVDNNFVSGGAGDLRYLQIAGGTMTGQLTLAGNPSLALQAAPKQYVDGRTPITIDAPADSQIYGRQNGGWAVVGSGTGGGISDAPNNSFAYLRSGAAWSSGGTLSGNLTINGVTTLSADPTAALGAATKQYVDNKIAQPSPSVPLMDGTAATGTSTQFARGDHIHPSDTSRYAASNPSGYVNTTQAAAAAPVQSVAGRTGAVTLTHTDITDWTATLAPYALLASPALTGTPTAPTATAGTNTNQIATTQFVSNAVSSATTPSNVAPGMDGTATAGVLTTYSRGDHIHPTDTSRASVSSLSNYLALSGGTMTGVLTLATNPVGNFDAVPKQYVDTPTNMSLDMGTF